jgi:hypothetical protein
MTMRTRFQDRLQQRLKEYTPDMADADDIPDGASDPVDALRAAAPRVQTSQRAMLLIDCQRRLVNVNPAAAALLDLDEDEASGMRVEACANGALTAIALRPYALLTLTHFQLPNGANVLAKTRPLYNEKNRCTGWVVELQDADDMDDIDLFGPEPANAQLPSTSASTAGNAAGSISASAARISNELQEELFKMRELITMLPQFSQHPYWRHLLMEHMERLHSDISSHVQQIT